MYEFFQKARKSICMNGLQLNGKMLSNGNLVFN